MWLKLSQVSTGDSALVGHGGLVGAPSESLHYMIRNFYLLSGFFANDVVSRQFASPNTWYHIVFVNTAEHGRQMYINGAQVVNVGAPGQRYRGVGKLYLGTAAFDRGRRVSGLMDEVMIFDRALSREDVFHLFNNVHQQAPPSMASCSALGEARFPTAKYFGLSGETPHTVFCGQGMRVAPPGYMLPIIARVAPVLYLAMNGEVRDAIGKVNVALGRGTVSYVDGVNGQALHFPDNRAGGAFYDIGLPSSVFTGSWTFALFVRLGRLGIGGDNVLLCEGKPENHRSLHLTVRGDTLYFVRLDLAKVLAMCAS